MKKLISQTLTILGDEMGKGYPTPTLQFLFSRTYPYSTSQIE